MSDRKSTAVICDMDGTLCDVTTVRHHVLATPKNFDAFHAGSLDCPPHREALEYAEKSADAGHALLVVTGRMEAWRGITEEWLGRYMNRKWHGPWMRPDGDYRKDTEIKREIYDELRARWDIVGAIDDNPAIVELWQSLGIPTVVVAGWEYGTVPVAYPIGHGDPLPSFTCTQCGATSYHPADVAERYCSQCNDWTGDEVRESVDVDV